MTINPQNDGRPAPAARGGKLHREFVEAMRVRRARAGSMVTIDDMITSMGYKSRPSASLALYRLERGGILVAVPGGGRARGYKLDPSWNAMPEDA